MQEKIKEKIKAYKEILELLRFFGLSDLFELENPEFLRKYSVKISEILNLDSKKQASKGK